MNLLLLLFLLVLVREVWSSSLKDFHEQLYRIIYASCRHKKTLPFCLSRQLAFLGSFSLFQVCMYFCYRGKCKCPLAYLHTLNTTTNNKITGELLTWEGRILTFLFFSRENAERRYGKRQRKTWFEEEWMKWRSYWVGYTKASTTHRLRFNKKSIFFWNEEKDDDEGNDDVIII